MVHILPSRVLAVLTRPKIFLHRIDRELRAHFRARTKTLEEKTATQRKRQGLGVLGWKKVTKVKWNAVALSFKSVFEPIPILAADSIKDRLLHTQEIRAFRARYQKELDIYAFDCPNKATFPCESWKG